MSQEKIETLLTESKDPFGGLSRKNFTERDRQLWPSEVPQEITSGAIIADPNQPGCYCIDANTAHGTRKFRSAQEEKGEAQSEDFPFSIQQGNFGFFGGKPNRKSFKVIRWNQFGRRLARQRSEKVEKEDSITPVNLLSKIASENTSHEEKRSAVIESEVVSFSSDQENALCRLLRRFIEQYRNSEDPQDLIAVGAAIRKYVVTIDQEHFSDLAIFLDSAQNATIPIEVELEVVKMLVRRLIQSPPKQTNSEPQLADRLFEIVDDYLKPRLLSRDKVAAVTLNAILAICLLRSSHFDDLYRIFSGLRVVWFSDLVLRRALQIKNKLFEMFDEEQAENYAEQLAALNEKAATFNA
jgi:hypothetical protein